MEEARSGPQRFHFYIVQQELTCFHLSIGGDVTCSIVDLNFSVHVDVCHYFSTGFGPLTGF